MPELPEITSRAREMHAALPGKTIRSILVKQPKCLNLTEAEFLTALVYARIEEVTHHGKWIKVLTTSGWLLINLGMGGEILLTDSENLPTKHRIVFFFEDNSALSINFWWFGYVYYSELEKLDKIAMIAKLGPEILEVKEQEFTEAIRSAKPRLKLKSYLLDQSNFSGIGNAYIHDILFMARLHPERKLGTLTHEEIASLFQAIKGGLLPSAEKGGAFYELDLYGNKGRFQMEDILVGYKEDLLCPKCGQLILKIRTGSTNSYICPSCQPLPE
jgi:formamidopyrimidine-DNA glycosylase